MQKVIEHLEKELERQNLLIATNADMKAELEQQGMWDWPRGPIPEEIYPNMEQFRDELELAIEYLKNK